MAGNSADFFIKYDPAVDTSNDLFNKILYVLYVKRIRGKKPAVTFIAGDSGEGKSETTLTIMHTILKLQRINTMDYINDINVYTPLEYPTKLNALLRDKRLKEPNVIAIHEAREAVKAKNWNTFINTAIADVNAMSRAIKPLAFFIVSQFIRDIDTSIRYTLTYYITTRRDTGGPVKIKIYKLWKDDRDIQNPVLRKMPVWGYLVYPNGKHRRYYPSDITVARAPKDLREIMETADREAKGGILKRKMDKLISEMQVEVGQQSNKIKSMVDWYAQTPERLTTLGKRNKNGNWKLHKEVMDMHDITPSEFQQFEKLLNTTLLSKGLIKEDG